MCFTNPKTVKDNKTYKTINKANTDNNIAAKQQQLAIPKTKLVKTYCKRTKD